MIRQLTTKEIEEASRALISARPSNSGIEVTMPVVYPNGRAVNVVVTVEAGEYVVHDAGGGSMYLTAAGIKTSSRMRARLAEMARHYGCEFIGGRMTTRCTEDQVAVAIVLVANASRTVGDEALSQSGYREHDFVENVASSLREVAGNRLRERAEVVGDSGKRYRVAHVILDKNLSAPIAFVEAVPSREVVARRVAEFLDLREEYANVQREAVWDDRVAFPTEELNLLGRVANTVPFTSSRNRFINLANAA